MKIAVDLDVLSERGTTVAALDYATYGKLYSGVETTLFYRTIDCNESDKVLSRISKRFEVIRYNDASDLCTAIKTVKADIYYKMIFREDKNCTISEVPCAYHSVFDFDNPIGNVYAYASKWLSCHVTGGRRPHVPHIVLMPKPDGNLRKELNIPEDMVVIGRYGGKSQFDIPFVHRVITEIVTERKDIYFLFANTEPFIDHPRIKYLPLILENDMKARFIASCDWMLHARYSGESFGLSMAEFLSLNCPVLCWAGGWDRNHVLIQPHKELIYATAGDLLRLLKRVTRYNKPLDNSKAVRAFLPEIVWPQWKKVFIDEIENVASLSETPIYYKVRRRLKNRFHKLQNKVFQLI